MLEQGLVFSGLAVALGLIVLGGIIWLNRRRIARKLALERIQSEDYLGAAKIYEDIGLHQQAALFYFKSKDHVRAVQVMIAQKDFDSALEMLRGAPPDQLEDGAELLVLTGALDSHRRAGSLAQLARSSGLYALAASLFERAGNIDDCKAAWVQEARGLSAQGNPLGAAKIYEKLGDLHSAAASLAESARSETDRTKKQTITSRAADLFKRSGDTQGAADALAAGGDIEAGVQLLLSESNVTGAAHLLRWYGHHKDAAQLFEQAGDFVRASKAYGNAGDALKAAAMLEKADDPLGAIRVLLEAHQHAAAAQFHLEKGSYSAAAEILANVGDVDGARKIYENAQDLDSAVELLCRHNRHSDAASLLESRGEYNRALLLLADVEGTPLQKANILATQGQSEEAAQAFLDLGQPQDARAILAQISAPTPLSLFLLARANMALHNFEEASCCYQALLDGNLPQKIEKTEILYGLASAMEALGQNQEAVDYFSQLLTLSPNYRDAQFKKKLLIPRLQETDSPYPIPLSSSSAVPVDSRSMEATKQIYIRNTGVPSRYLVEGVLGRGSMGVVYRGIDSQLGRTVAIKILEKSRSEEERIRSYFENEARAIALLNHPYLVTLYDAGMDGSTPYIVMEYVEGEDLRSQITNRKLNMRMSVQIIAGIASALGYAHGKKIIHRDVKPDNILVNRHGIPKLMDFGVAHVMSNGSEKHATVVGTPTYMAPEQIRGETIGGFTDIYALGIVLYECLTGCTPFNENSALYDHVNKEAPNPRSYRPLIPEPLSELVMQCLAKAPEKRPASAQLLSDALLALAPSLSTTY